MDRFVNLTRVLQWLKLMNVPNIEIVILEQDSKPTLGIPLDTGLNIRHIFVRNEKLFNRAWGFNCAIRNTTNPILFFADSDMIVNPVAITESINLLRTNQFDVVSPFVHCLDLTVDETSNLNLATFNYDLEKPPRGGMNFCSGIVAYNRPALERIYAWDERFEGWGGEDDIQFMKTRQLLKYVTLNYKCFHMHHSRSKNDGLNAHDNYQNNLRLFWQYHHNVPQILVDMKNYPNWGNVNKYAG